MTDSLGKWLVLLGYAAILVVLVRPGSQGPGFVEDVGTAMANLVTASTGGGTWGDSGSGSTSGAGTATGSGSTGTGTGSRGGGGAVRSSSGGGRGGGR